jgi:acyl-CoA carboxylase subunit alpha
MLAKLISYAPTRSRATQLLADALARTRIHGMKTNRDLLVNVLRHPAFRDGATDTAFFDTHGLTELAAPLIDARAVRLAAVAAAMAEVEQNRAAATVLTAVPSGWRNLASGNQAKTFTAGDRAERVEYRCTRTGPALPDDDGVRVVTAGAERVVLSDASGVEIPFEITRYGDQLWVDSPLGAVHLVAVPRFVEPGSAVLKGSLVAPMPGVVVRIGAEVGAGITAGQPLVWLEAMKMEHIITAPADGVLTELHVQQGTQVEVGQVLALVDTEATEGEQ